MARVEGIDVHGLTDGQLLTRRRAYEAKTSWAPKHVAEELRAARKQEQFSNVEATRHAYEAAEAVRRGKTEIAAWHEKASGSWTALGQRATLVPDKLTEAHDTRYQWEAMTEPTRRLGRAADIELKRRGVLGREDHLRSAEPEGFIYSPREHVREVWVQPRLVSGPGCYAASPWSWRTCSGVSCRCQNSHPGRPWLISWPSAGGGTASTGHRAWPKQ